MSTAMKPDKAALKAAKAARREEMAALDALQARMNVRRAENMRLVESWFPKPSEEDLKGAEGEQVPELDLASVVAPPRLGLGAPIPKEWMQNGDIYEREKLRRTILTKRQRHDSDDHPSGPGHDGAKGRDHKKPRHGNSNGSNPERVEEESDDEEEVGRSALGKKKKGKGGDEKKVEKAQEEGVGKAAATSTAADDSEEEEGGKGGGKVKAASASFFDAYKSSKNKKKKNKKKQNMESSSS